MESFSSLIVSVDWVRSILLGTIGTAIAVLAVSAVGVSMLTGRVPVKRGMSVVVGCFVLFSAGSIADALVAGARGSSEPDAQEAVPAPPRYTPSLPKAAPYDPYAGASVPTPERMRGAEAPFR